MLNRFLVSKNFMYKTNDFNFRLGFKEENSVKRPMLFTRIDHWKNVFTRYLLLKPNNKLMLYLNQTSLDTFAIYLAAIECDLDLVEENADIIIHTLADSQLQKLNLDAITNYNIFDLADIKFSGLCNYIQKGNSCVYGKDLCDIEIKKSKINGSVLHTKYLNSNLFFDFMLPVLHSDKVTFHTALGYTNVDEGIDKIVFVIQRLGLDNILLPSLETVNILTNKCKDKLVDISKLKIFSYDNGLCYNYSQTFYETNNDELKNIPHKFGINGKILQDKDTLYFQFNFPIDKNVAETKIKAINSFIKTKYKKQITKWAVLNQNDVDEAMIIFRNLKW